VHLRKANPTLRLTVHKLAKAYGFLWALKEIDVDLVPGSFVALLGPNGAGKTTFLKLLAGLTLPSKGMIEINGNPIVRSEVTWRANVGMLTPGDHLYDNLTAAENLYLFCGLYGRAANSDEIEAALEAVDLAPRANDWVGNLSTGMKCRISIAKWQLLKPGLLLLDEPYGVLDGKGVDLLENFLTAHCAGGNIVVMASHHVARALNLCNRAIILNQGRVTFDETKQQPWPSFVKAFNEFLPHGESWHS
jgi:heme ABC exporter ATP-binding subunit CcmA